VDLEAAEKRGIPVFNSPFSNTRSVAELIIAEIILLSRRLGDKSNDMHKGVWDKSAKDCHEIRGKTLGIVGYGHIGSQLSVLAESLGMNVIFYDVISVLPLGNSKRKETLEEVLTQADFVTLHVPKTDQTKNMITEKQLKMMKKSSYLLNASRGTVVDIPALANALRSGHLAGAAVDVYPTEPEANIKDWQNELQNCPNTILTPHIGGSTEEAQYAIGLEVADKLIKFVNNGSTATAVNFPKLDLPVGQTGTHRILNIHKNVPGVLKNINTLLGDINVVGQMLAAKGAIGYLIVDVEKETSHNLRDEMAMLPTSIKTRILY
jgi:D-3-phosphoglycerate dehydrogenase